MKTRIIQIGNSQGVRIPKVLLEQSGLGEEVELKVNKGQIIIIPARKSERPGLPHSKIWPKKAMTYCLTRKR